MTRTATYLLNSLLLWSLLCTPHIAFSQQEELLQRLEKHVQVLSADTMQGRGLGTEGIEKARAYIKEQFKEAGIQARNNSYEMPFRFRTGNIWVPATNLVGYIEGSDPDLKQEYIVLGAHYDHLGYSLKDGEKTIYFGADDNASGVASIIELGRYFAKNPHKLKRSLIIVAFDAEESGLHGSRHFAHHPPVPLENIKMMFSLDMVGMYKNHGGLDLTGIGMLKGGRDLARKLAKDHNLNLKNTSAELVKNTDTAPFGDKGVIAVAVFTGLGTHYHRPRDQYHILDLEGMEKINIFMRSLISWLSEIDSFDKHLEESVFATGGISRFKSGFMLGIGSGYHTYENRFFKAHKATNFSGGLFFQLAIGRLISLQQEVMYEYLGSQMAKDETLRKGSFRRHAATLPLNLMLGSPNINMPTRAHAFVGPYYRYSFAGTDPQGDLNFETLYNEEEWGYNAGFRIEIMQFSFQYTYRSAFTNLLQSDDTYFIRDINNMISLGYRF